MRERACFSLLSLPLSPDENSCFLIKAAEPIGAAAEVTRVQQSSRSVNSDEGLEVGQLAGESPVITVRRIERFLGRVSAPPPSGRR